MTKCVVCSKSAKYTCARCSKPYCRLQHYRQHNLFCTESFYKQQVEQHLKTVRATEEDKNKMKQILKEQQEQPDEIPDDPYVRRLEELLQEIEAGSDVKLSHLEEVDFAKYIEEHAHEAAVQFWEVEEGLPFYYILDYEPEDYSELTLMRKVYAEGIRHIPPVKQLSSIVSPQCQYHIVSMVYAGALVLRYHDGEMAQHDLLALCQTLHKAVTITDVSQALLAVESQIPQCSQNYKAWCLLALSDCKKILSNKYLTMEMCCRIRDSLKNKRVAKKVQFMIAYWREHNTTVLGLDEEIQLRRQRLEQEDMVRRIRQHSDISV